jgi:hypothetical protein
LKKPGGARAVKTIFMLCFSTIRLLVYTKSPDRFFCIIYAAYAAANTKNNRKSLGAPRRPELWNFEMLLVLQSRKAALRNKNDAGTKIPAWQSYI